MHCKNCGAELNPRAKFCPSCGTAVEASGPKDEAQAEVTPEPFAPAVLEPLPAPEPIPAPEPVGTPASESESQPVSAPVATPAPEPEPEPEPVAMPAPEAMPAPAPEPTSAPASEPVPTPVPAPGSAPAEGPAPKTKVPWYASVPARIVIGLFGVFLLVSGIIKLAGVFNPAPPTDKADKPVVVEGAGKPATVTFYGGGTDKGTVEPIETTTGETIKLPENGFESKKHHFAGWARIEDGTDGQDVSATTEPLAPGTEVVVETEQEKYAAVWDIEVKFDGNGAGGKMDSVYVPIDSDYTLPDNGFESNGLHFIGWTTNHEDIGPGTPLYAVGDTWKATTNVTFVARWQPGTPIQDISITDSGKTIEGSFTGLSGDSNGCILRVTNNTADPLTLETTYRFVNAAGGLRDKQIETSYIEPGASRLLHATDLKRSDGIEYEIQPKAEAFHKPIGENVKVEQTSATADELTLKITNPGPNTVLVSHVRCLIKMPDGSIFGGDSYKTGTLKPNESLEATFTKDSMYDFQLFTTFEGAEPTYSIDGYAYSK